MLVKKLAPLRFQIFSGEEGVSLEAKTCLGSCLPGEATGSGDSRATMESLQMFKTRGPSVTTPSCDHLLGSPEGPERYLGAQFQPVKDPELGKEKMVGGS